MNKYNIGWIECKQCPEPHPLLYGIMTVYYGNCPIWWDKNVGKELFEELSEASPKGNENKK